MPHYSFHSEETGAPVVDLNGRELRDDDAAVREAQTAVSEALTEAMKRGESPARVSVAVSRSDGSRVVLVTAEATTARAGAD